MLAEQNSTVLRDRVEYLEEENRQLREIMGLDEDEGFLVAARAAFQTTKAQGRVLQVLVTGAVVRNEALMLACTPTGEASDNNLKVQLSRLRRKLGPYGLAVKNEWGVGYSMSPEHRVMAADIMASAVGREASH